jgi:hypothetical protein
MKTRRRVSVPKNVLIEQQHLRLVISNIATYAMIESAENVLDLMRTSALNVALIATLTELIQTCKQVLASVMAITAEQTMICSAPNASQLTATSVT